MSDAACPVNLGPRQARQRAITGVSALLAAGVLLWLGLRDPSLAWARWVAPVGIGLGVLGLLQARAKT